MSVRVVAPCRLHFGLFHVPVDGLTHYPDGRPVRKFGGLGMMIDEPCVTVTALWSQHEGTTGSLSNRATNFLQSMGLDRPNDRSPLAVLADGPPEHVGLGVGTALGMALGRAVYHGILWEEWVVDNRSGSPESPAEQVAERVGRGKRSGIGVKGFSTGGFLIDEGKESDEDADIDGAKYPSPWRIVLVRPPTPPTWFGDRERSAFARTRPADRALSLTERLRSLAYDTIVPAVRDEDFDTFAQSIFEFNRLAGEPFQDDQGGVYASPEVACVIDELMEMGAVGVGQSSWGPTVFAMCRDADEAEHLAAKARARFSSATEVIVTTANNTGARLETL